MWTQIYSYLYSSLKIVFVTHCSWYNCTTETISQCTWLYSWNHPRFGCISCPNNKHEISRKVPNNPKKRDALLSKKKGDWQSQKRCQSIVQLISTLLYSCIQKPSQKACLTIVRHLFWEVSHLFGDCQASFLGSSCNFSGISHLSFFSFKLIFHKHLTFVRKTNRHQNTALDAVYKSSAPSL